MAKNPRLHEVAKALGQTAKTLMAELASAGHEYKTHMASLEDAALEYLNKKYPSLGSGLKSQEKEKAAKPKTPKASKPKTSKMITQRSKSQATAKKDEPSSASMEGLGRPKVEIVEKEGESVEQKVMKGGIIRRRRVETPVEVPKTEEFVTSAVELEEDIAAPVASNESLGESVLEEDVQNEEVAFESSSVPEEEVPVEETPEVIAEETPAPAARVEEVKIEPQAPTGRNLSAPRRLKIVGESSPPRPAAPVGRPRPAVRPDKNASPQAPKTIGEEVKKPVTAVGEEEAESADSKKKAGVKKAASLKNWVAPRVTKKDLLGMTEEVEISRLGGRRGKKQAPRQERKTKITTPGASKRKIRIEQEITVADLADRMGIKAADIVRKLISMGQMVNAHQHIDFDTASLIASDYDYEIQNVAQTAESLIHADVQGVVDDSSTDEEGSEHRPPIVTIMGHVDHGKTSLLDYIRKSKVVASEAGGITQHIGAYQVKQGDKLISFLDTPGHEAFTKMRARGASATDIVILVVAADEGVKPQTLEAVAHAKAAEVPIIVAINKMDKSEANPDRVMQELSGHELVPEDWGGDTIFVKVSAHSGEGVSNLLEMILLQAEVLELKANPQRPAKAIVIESRLDKGKGPVASVVVTNGTLRQGDPVVCSTSYGKVRAMFDDIGRPIKEAGPSTPVEILGFNSVPEAGEIMTAVSEEGVARKASDLALSAKRMEDQRRAARVSLEDMYKKMKSGEINELRLILKADVQGSVEAIADSLEKIESKDVKVNIVYRAVGGISESDVSLAAASGALIVGFNVRPTNQAKQLAHQENIQIKSYGIIYELLDDVKLAMQGLLAPEIKEQVLGQAEVRDVFNLSKVGPIAGCYVKSGKILRNASARLIRDSVVIYDAKIASLRRFKDDAREVAEGFECGIRLENYSDMKAGDIIECYEKVEMKVALSS